MKIIITGGCGFIGHHFVEHVYKNTDWDIIVIDRLSYASNGFERLRDTEVLDNKRVKVITCDLILPLSEGIIKEISEYCERDVEASIKLAIEISAEKLEEAI